MRFPTHLVKNRFGIYYYCVVFPLRIVAIIHKKQARRSLGTSDSNLAVMMSLEFTRAVEWLFERILAGVMNWIETQKFLDDVAEKLYQKYVKKVHDVGFDFQDHDSLAAILPEAKVFLGKPPSNPVSASYFELDKADFDASYHTKKELTDFVDSIFQEHLNDIKPDSDTYKRVCKQTLEMLNRLDMRKEAFRGSMITGQPVPPIAALPVQHITAASTTNIKTTTLKQLIKQFRTVKTSIEKTWKNPRTVKGYDENLERIAEIFAVVTGDPEFPVAALTKEHAREAREILSIIPTNLKKRYGNLTMHQVIKKCRAGEIAQLDSDRLKPSTFNTYANLITGMFRYAEDEDFVAKNYFSNIRVPKQTEKVRVAFTNQELKLFFNTDLYLKKDFQLKWSWRYWVPVIMLYSGCRLEEVCQLSLSRIIHHKEV